MSVQELINELNKIEDKSFKVYVRDIDDYDTVRMVDVNEVRKKVILFC